MGSQATSGGTSSLVPRRARERALRAVGEPRWRRHGSSGLALTYPPSVPCEAVDERAEAGGIHAASSAAGVNLASPPFCKRPARLISFLGSSKLYRALRARSKPSLMRREGSSTQNAKSQ